MEMEDIRIEGYGTGPAYFYARATHLPTGIVVLGEFGGTRSDLVARLRRAVEESQEK